MKKQMTVILFLILALLCSACSATQNTAPPAAVPEAPADSSAAPQSAAGAEKAAAATEGYAMPEGEADIFYQYPPDYQQGETYLSIDENTEQLLQDEQAITFSLKVDTASYSNVERYISDGNLPPADAVRVEELINYFRYEGDVSAKLGDPFGIYTEIGRSPFNPQKYLAFIRVKSKDIDKSELPASNLTFLIDTSGSMDSYDKLPLLKDAFALLVETLGENDKVSIVTYAGSAGVVLDSASGADKQAILSAINDLRPSGSTAGGAGIQTAYALAEKNFTPGGNNRVILATDGDFNVGVSTVDELIGLISEKRGNGVYLSVLGFGTGNLRDDMMETLATNGNGNYSYINSLRTAKKVLIDELASNLYTVADDVKAQITFDPDAVQSYRLIGYENRKMDNEDFENDFKDAGEIGVGTDVVVLVELTLKQESPPPTTDLFSVDIRYKDPGESKSKLIEHPVSFSRYLAANSSDFNFACSVAGFGHLLRGSEYAGDFTIAQVTALAEKNLGRDTEGYRQDYLALLREYQRFA